MTDDQDASWLTDDSDGPESGQTWHGEAGEIVQPSSEHAVVLDKWGKRQGEDLVKHRAFQDIKATPADAADMFGMAFNYEPIINENCVDPHKVQFLKSMEQDGEYQALRASTQLDRLASELAALHFNQGFATYKTTKEKEDKKKKPGDGPPSEKDKMRDEMRAAGAVGKAVDAATQDVNELNDCREAMGIGKEAGSGGQLNPNEVKKLFQHIRNNRNIKDVMERAGRYRLTARAKQIAKTIHGYDDMVGVTLGNDIPRLVPIELAALGIPGLQFDAVMRYVSKQMMQRNYHGVNKIGRGPIIIEIDESGSMAGERIANAYALALAMAYVARRQNRWCAFVGFSSKGQVRSIALPPDKWPTMKVLEWFSGFLNGGTELPLDETPELYKTLGAKKGKTDLIIITDGDTSTIQPAERARFEAWKKEAQCKVIGLSIATEARQLKSVCDEFYRIPGLTPDNDAVGRVLSV